MLERFRKTKIEGQENSGYQRTIIPDWMGYPRSDYSRYDPYGEERWSPERKSIHALEGAGRKGWDYDQNRTYGSVYGNHAGHSQINEMPNHKGKGPRNYRRSDERIQEDIHDRLSRDWSLDSSDIEVSVKEGVVHLHGKVTDRSVKYRIEDITESVAGVRDIENKIRIAK
jgi:hypothetical protein